MTQRTFYILMFALGGVMLTLPVFGTSTTPIKVSSAVIDSPADTGIIICTFLLFDLSVTDEGVFTEWLNISQGTNEPIDYYELEYSTTGFDFLVLDRLGSDEFSHLHQSPINGNNYYRLKIVETSGNVTYTSIALAYWELTPGNISPSLVDKATSLFIESSIEESGELNIYDMTGRLIYSETITLQENSTLINLDFTSWHRGHYVVTLSGEQLGDKVFRFVKQ